MTGKGRPRSEQSREAILKAAHDLLKEGGAGGLTMEGLARRAGVGKPTLYRWWPSPADIVLDALLSEVDTEIPVPKYEDLEQSLTRFLGDSMAALEWCGVHLRYLMAQAQKDDGFRDRFRNRFTARRRGVLRAIFEEAAARGHLPAKLNPELLTDMVFGPMWYRLLTGHGPLDTAFARELAATVSRLAA